jgi:hypothetical protein
MHILQTAHELQQIVNRPADETTNFDPFTNLAHYVARCEAELERRFVGTNYLLGSSELSTRLPRPNKPDEIVQGAYSHPFGLAVLYTRTIASRRGLAVLLGNKPEGTLAVLAPAFGNETQPVKYHTTLTSFSRGLTELILIASARIARDKQAQFTFEWRHRR